ncbi:MAG: hypothetical protein M5R36_10455 [Deltaproteobacteria bacterium]|nr:hypothetical protein [Deltaproteobacteria bacterium]
MLLAAFFILALPGCGCGDDDDPSASSGQAPDDDTDSEIDDDDDDTGPDDDVDDDDDHPPVTHYDLDLVFELRNAAKLHLWQTGAELTGTLMAREGVGNDLMPPDVLFTGEGRVMYFPEAQYEIFQLSMQGGVVPGGACGDEPVHYELTLTGQNGSTERLGGIAAYCGTAATGLPKRMLRIKTRL